MTDQLELQLTSGLHTSPSARSDELSDGRPTLRLDEFGDVLTVEEAARVLRISRASAYELARQWRSENPSGLPVIQVGRRLLVPRSALEEVLQRPAQLYRDLKESGSDG